MIMSSDSKPPMYTSNDLTRASANPLPRTPATTNSSNSSRAIIYPPIPPRPDPMRVTIDENGHRRLPFLSNNPLSVDHERVHRYITFRPYAAKCSNCSEDRCSCDFTEHGRPCSACASTCRPDCDFVNPYGFIAVLAHYRDLYLHEEFKALRACVEAGQLSSSRLDREFERAAAWFYSGAQGAVTRFILNHRATDGMMLRGIFHIVSSITDTGLLTQFLAVMHDKLHPAAIQVIVDRLNTIYGALHN
ncbi:hypothetical protein R3P38DRAFT_2649831 [Favolaschia claudopus]|uniref:Uncharacterized protein n=1 Tax=Favolaschia claudopus TaxID=2862362 RepID=A0AAW0A588_9AGAR